MGESLAPPNEHTGLGGGQEASLHLSMQSLPLRLYAAVALVAATPAVATVAGCGSLAPAAPGLDSGVAGETHEGGAGIADATSRGDGGGSIGWPDDASASAPDAPIETQSDAQVDASAYSITPGQCTPPCDQGEFCYALIVRGGAPVSHVPFSGSGDAGDAGSDAGDGSTGCNPLPAACEQASTCACLLGAVHSAPQWCSIIRCVTDDAGRPTVICEEDLP